MDRYQMGRGGGRPYRTTCGMNRMTYPSQQPESDFFQHADQLPLAMGYVPDQKFQKTFDLSRALSYGTIFPELCKPFCGKRGVCR